MAKFLTTTGNSYFIEQIILNAESSLTIVSPYLKLSPTIFERLRDADKLGIKICLVYGKNELPERELAPFKEINSLEIYFCHNLHAKCYHNETKMIISSMNLHEFSEKNNREMGILIDKEFDKDIYVETLKEIESIKNASKKQKSFSLEKTKEKKHDTINYSLDPKYKDDWNFHLPAVYQMLKLKFPELNIKFNDDIKIEDFPKKNITSAISGRIDLKFSEQFDYAKIVNLNKYNFKLLLPQVRFYWNKNAINIYLESSFNDELTISGLERKAKRMFEIFTTVSDNLEV